jgi:hypothetical protein
VVVVVVVVVAGERGAGAVVVGADITRGGVPAEVDGGAACLDDGAGCVPDILFEAGGGATDAPPEVGGPE